MTGFVLRPWKIEDAPSVARFADNERIASNLRDAFPHPYSLADAQEFVGSCVANEGRGQLTRAIEIGGAAAGSVSVFLGTDVYRLSAELGYWLAEDYWGQGVMTRAVMQICREAFERFDIVRIYAEPFEGNAASRAVLEKAGFTCEGIMRSGVYKNGAVQSYCMYSLLRGETSRSADSGCGALKKFGGTGMKFKMVHENYNVADLNVSLKFYEQALGLTERRRRETEDFTIVYVGNTESDFELELTQLKDHPQKYDLGECEFHLAFRTDDFDAAYDKHKAMGCICFENKALGVYFIEDPDGYWIEIIPVR